MVVPALTRYDPQKGWIPHNAIPFRKRQKEDRDDSALDNDTPVDDDFLDRLSSTERADANSAISQFGLETVAKAYSKSWEERRKGLEQVQGHLGRMSTKEDARAALSAALPIIARGLSDKLFNIANQYMTRFMLPFDTTGSTRCDQGKAKIVWNGVNILWEKNLSSVTEKKVSNFAVQCLRHTDGEVRNVGKNLVIFIYQRGDREMSTANEGEKRFTQ
ncbi:hypothetical protein AAVH_07854 [Aphelenchoides avenae]|nr:hypothetical protein AAVH_07854 [Aphelenchus avenae]